MKALILILLIGLTGCSSTGEKHGGIGDLGKDDQMLGDPLPEWVDFEGMKNGYIYAIGEAEYDAEKSPTMVKEAAQHNAKMRIVERMPTDYKSVVIRSISDASNGEFNKVEVSKADLQGMSGVSISRRFTTCRKIVRHTKYDKELKRTCFVRASVPIKNFNEAVVRTVKNKYGDDVSSKFEKALQRNIEDSLN
jgi:hypothetical protein